MKRLYRHLHKEEKGFTLVELMVVIIILAVLTGIAVPSYMALRNRARIQATRSEMQNIATAIAIFEADTGSFPVATTAAALETALEGADSSGDDVYMENCPTTDAWNASYVVSSAVGSYTLTSQAGTTEDATDDIVMTDGVFSGE